MLYYGIGLGLLLGGLTVCGMAIGYIIGRWWK